MSLPSPARGGPPRSILAAHSLLDSSENRLQVVDVNQLEARAEERARRHDDAQGANNTRPSRKRDAAYMAAAAKASRARKRAKVAQMQAQVQAMAVTAAAQAQARDQAQASRHKACYLRA